ncbi:recombinase family protein [Celeribacter sp.]|uniref:recombinase family protein n=1 Tax=Alphaproteobacteria TaxID=28211 RepID=UPI003A8CF4C8
MSTEHQKYSTENQAKIIAQYAARRGFEIVKIYEESGKSGLRLDGRLSLQRSSPTCEAVRPTSRRS